MTMTRIFVAAGMTTALVLGFNPTARAECSQNGDLHESNTCQQNIEQLAGYGQISCANPRNHDQSTFCGAVYGYEANWCARIHNAILRQDCWEKVE